MIMAVTGLTPPVHLPFTFLKTFIEILIGKYSRTTQGCPPEITVCLHVSLQYLKLCCTIVLYSYAVQLIRYGEVIISLLSPVIISLQHFVFSVPVPARPVVRNSRGVIIFVNHPAVRRLENTKYGMISPSPPGGRWWPGSPLVITVLGELNSIIPCRESGDTYNLELLI